VFKYIARQMLMGLAHIHAANIVHCDIKAENVLINPETFDVKIIDFGLSSDLKVGKEDTKTLLKGTYV